MSNERPPRDGLTREDTGYPAAPYHGWYWTERGMIGIERRARRRPRDLADYHAQPEPLPTHGFASARPKTTVRVCANPACGVTFIARSATGRYHSPQCQRAAQRARDKARRETA